MKILFNIIVYMTLVCLNNYLFACTIFTSASNDVVLAGNNEDMCTTNTIIHLIPPSQDNYGRILWGFKGEGNYQGGMNEYGLFFDGAGTPKVEMAYKWDLPKYNGDYVMQGALEQCKTVEEALEFIKNYKMPYLQHCHILLADATGDAVLIEWGNNKLNFLRKADKNFLIATNFNITETTDPEDECYRYLTVQNMLDNSEPNIELYKNILSLTHVEGKYPTVYSTICDLKNQKVYLYNFHNYSFCKELDLNEELAKGEKQYMIRSFFPVSTSELMFRMMNDCIDDFENVPTSLITFKINLKKPFEEEKLFINGSAKELGDWDEPGIELERINNNTFEKTIPFKEGKMFDFSISALNDKYFLFDSNNELLKEKTVEAKTDTTVIINISDWKLKE